jgi:hypothetical protein
MASADLPMPASPSAQKSMTPEERRVVLASSVGTVFEWYDFYLYGALTVIMAKQFFGGLDPATGFVFALLAFAAAFARLGLSSSAAWVT